MEFVRIDARISELNIYEALRYLGYRGQELNDSLMNQVRSCLEQIAASSTPKLVYRIFEMPRPETEGPVKPGAPLMEQLAHASFLQGCSHIVMMAATLGPEVERLLMRKEVTDMADAVIMDACGGVVIENVCGNFEADLRTQLSEQGLFLTDRYSPGYAELELGLQGDWCEVLNTYRRIGLSVTDNSLLIPRKSVTAVMGISDKKVNRRPRGCATCNMAKICTYRTANRACS